MSLYGNYHIFAQYNSTAVEHKWFKLNILKAQEMYKVNQTFFLHIQQLIAPWVYHLFLQGRNCQWGKALMMIGCKGRGQYIHPDKCHGLPWQIINGLQEPLADTLYCSHPHKFLQKSKSSFFILQSNGGPCLFHFIWHSWRPPTVAQVTSVFYTIRERHIFGFSLSERKFWNIVQWCRKSFERLWERFACKASESWSVGEEVSMLHPYRMESYLIPPVSIFYFLYFSKLPGGF